MAKRRIDVFTENLRLPYEGINKRYLVNTVKRAAELLSLDNVIINVILTDNGHMREINRKYRNKDRPTDVLSFAYREDPFPEVTGDLEELGDIYISGERAREQAEEYGVSIKDEFKRLLVHGLLHLVGYDHERSKKDEKIMQDKEEELFNLIAVK